MESSTAAAMLSALGHEGRLSIFRLLVKGGPTGVAAGEMARALNVLPNTLSANLALLSRAGLIVSRRQGRSIVYAARYEGMQDLLAFLVEDCCNGRPEICGPLGEIARKGCAA